MDLVTRQEWGGGARRATPDDHPMDPTVYGTAVHWNGPAIRIATHADCPLRVKGIQAYHLGKGWADIAYNYLVCPHGSVYVGRGVGVASAANGTATLNRRWYAVMYLGGQGDPYTAAGKRAMAATVNLLRKAGAGPKVVGHRDLFATACPGDVIEAWVKAGVPEYTDWLVTGLQALRDKARSLKVKAMIAGWIEQAKNR